MSLSNSYGRCKINNATSVNDEELSVSAYYNGNTAWPTDGLVAAGTYSSVATNVTCGTSLPAQQVTCPALTVKAGSDHTFTDFSSIDINIGECMDVEYNWVPSSCSQYHCEGSPLMKIKCDIKPNYEHSETVGASKTGYVEIIYNSNTVKGSGNYNVSAEVTLKAAVEACGSNCTVTQGQLFEFSNICTDAYVSGNSGTTKEPVSGKKLACSFTRN